MMFAHEAGVAIPLVMMTLWLQCGGMAILISWVRRVATRDIHKLGRFHTAALFVRLTTAIVALHLLEILLWAGRYRWL